jgi:hypothetical protein
MHVVWKRVHWCVVVFDGNKTQLFKDTDIQQDAFRKDYLLECSAVTGAWIMLSMVHT